MDRKMLFKEIVEKKKELNILVRRKQSLHDREVYQKSCELDELVVLYMKEKQ